MDPILILAQALLYALSALGVASSDTMPEPKDLVLGGKDEPEYLMDHLLRIAIGIGITLIVSRLKTDWVVKLARILFVVSLVLLVVVLFFPSGSAGGVRRWIPFPGFGFQPSELMKLSVVLYLAAFFHKKPTDYPIFGPVIAISLAAGLVIIEPDFDTGAFILVLAGLMMVVLGVPWRRLLAIGATAWVFALAFSGIYLERFKYVRERLENWLSYHQGNLSSGNLADGLFQVAQGHKLMIKAGLFGQGVGAPMPHRLPEGHNDMIFASIIWAGGWLAGAMVLIAFWLIFARGLQISANTTGSKSVMAIGLTGYLVMQAAINVGVVIGFIPVSGSPLPLVSYGGSSMLVSGIALGLLHALSREAFAENREESPAPKAQTTPAPRKRVRR